MNASTLYDHDDGGDAVEGDDIIIIYLYLHLAHSMEEEDSPSEEDPKKVNIWSSRGQKRPGIYSVYTGQQSEYIGSLYFHLFKIPSVLTFYC